MTERTTPISIYFGVDEGERASLEVIARATLEWTEAIRSLAFIIDPGLEVRVEFVESEDGSVWLSNLVRAVKEGDEKALKALAIGILAFFAIGPALHLQADFGDELFKALGHEDTVVLSDTEKQDIVNRVIEGIEKTNLLERRQAIIREVERDPAIRSVGVDTVPRREGPRVKISRSEFPSYGARTDQVVLPPERDTRQLLGIDVIVVRPTLRKGEDRPRWRFEKGGSEWSATIEDDEFIWAVRNGQTGLAMAIGERMKINVALDQEMQEGEWVIVNRRVTRVIEPAVNRRQGSMELGEPKPDAD